MNEKLLDKAFDDENRGLFFEAAKKFKEYATPSPSYSSDREYLKRAARCFVRSGKSKEAVQCLIDYFIGKDKGENWINDLDLPEIFELGVLNDFIDEAFRQHLPSEALIRAVADLMFEHIIEKQMSTAHSWRQAGGWTRFLEKMLKVHGIKGFIKLGDYHSVVKILDELCDALKNNDWDPPYVTDELEAAARWYEQAEMHERAAKIYAWLGQRQRNESEPPSDVASSKSTQDKDTSETKPPSDASSQSSCPQCGRQVQSHWLKCPDCKTQLKQKTCPNPNCREPLESHWTECPACETPV